MANDCLVTTLKGSVSADLPKLGECCIPVTNGQIMLNVTAAPLTIRGIGGVLLNGQETIVIQSTSWTSLITISGLPNDTTIGEIRLSNKYKSFTSIYAPMSGLVNLSPFNGMEQRMRQFGISYFANARATDETIASIKDIVEKFPNLTLLALGGSGASGNVLDLQPLSLTLTGLDGPNINGLGQSRIVGDFSDLGLLPNLNNLGSFVVQTQISGSINDFVASRRSVTQNAAGSVSGRWLSDGNRITYTGQAVINGETVTYDNEPVRPYTNNTISWDAAGNITLTQSGTMG